MNDTSSHMHEPQYRAWLKTQPRHIKRLAKEFPPASMFVVALPDGSVKIATLIGWDVGDKLILSYVHPSEDYEKACKEAFTVPASMYRARKQ